MATTGDALDEIISAIGDPAFPARAGRALAALTDFDLVAVVAHRQSSSTTSTGSAAAAGSLRLSISRHTVKDHRKHIFARLGISSLAELFAFGWRWLSADRIELTCRFVESAFHDTFVIARTADGLTLDRAVNSGARAWPTLRGTRVSNS